MKELEIRMRCLEAAVTLNASGRLVGLANVTDAADTFVEWVHATVPKAPARG